MENNLECIGCTNMQNDKLRTFIGVISKAAILFCPVCGKSLAKQEIKQDAIGTYLSAYKEQKDVEADLAKAKKVTLAAKDGFLEFMEANALTSVKRDGSTITCSKRTFGKIVDYDKLEAWVKESDEPRSLYMEEVFIKGSSKNEKGVHVMITDAQALAIKIHAPVSECLPPGLDLSVIDVVTVRASGARVARKKPTTAVERLQQAQEEEN